MSGDQVWIGSVLAERWEILDLLGRGGMGAVYRARHVHLGTDVAIKVLQNTARLEASAVARFYRESRLIGSLQHDHIIRVQDTGKTPSGDLYFVMEYLRGPNLRALLSRDGPLPWARTRAIVLQVCDALSAMHDRGVIHRDLKPHNIVLDPRPDRPDYIKLLDFGVAKSMGEDLTQAGVLLGTLAYMAPEYLYGAAPDRRIDIFALGIIAYELLTGQQPSSNAAANAAILHTRGVPLEGREAIVRALARDPDHRYDDARAFAAALSTAPEEPAVDAEETTRVRPPARAAAAATDPTPRPPSAPSTAATVVPAPPSAPSTAATTPRSLPRRDDDPTLALRSHDEDTTALAADDLTPVDEPGEADGRDEDKTVLVPGDGPQLKEPRELPAVFALPVPRQLEAPPVRGDSPEPARPEAHESAPPASMSARAVTVPEIARPRGAMPRIAAVLFGLAGLATLGYWWAHSPTPPDTHTSTKLADPPEPTPPIAPEAKAPSIVDPPPPQPAPADAKSPLSDDPPVPPRNAKTPPAEDPEPQVPPVEPPPEPKRTGLASYNNKLGAIKQKIRKCGQQAIAGESIELELSIDGDSGKATVTMKGPAILKGEPAVDCAVQAIQQLKFARFAGAPFVKNNTFTF
ncbi:serine/threonine-protein kinase [Nannocystis sp. SCPEA4]|uniref:serine/threonine protein kinase n=1 Tax=Nannocystis sp. SCPEA4 TaxID=2996787 RepID=UPI00226D8403|nr:serine/threonine-protein kinase [Nannocystis sp. SCPEA4]MCY1058861.1 protein kinase [Nannocystis sp. SCPEA4]